MLNMALIEKGVISSSGHNELTHTPTGATVNEQQQGVAAPTGRRVVVDELGEVPDDDGGIVL